jgi:hypothetical protein
MNTGPRGSRNALPRLKVARGIDRLKRALRACRLLAFASAGGWVSDWRREL